MFFNAMLCPSFLFFGFFSNSERRDEGSGSAFLQVSRVRVHAADVETPLGWSRSSLVWAHPGSFLIRQILQLPVLGVAHSLCKAHLLFLAQ